MKNLFRLRAFKKFANRFTNAESILLNPADFISLLAEFKLAVNNLVRVSPLNSLLAEVRLAVNNFVNVKP